MERLGQCCFDFVDSEGNPVNSSEEFKLIGSSRLRLISWEESAGFKREDIVPGEEKFAINEGSWAFLLRPGHEDCSFGAPPPS